MEWITAIINSSFDKLSFFGGIAFIMVSVFCINPVVFGPIKLPTIDKIGRSVSAIIGIILLAIPLFVFLANANVGLFSAPPSENKNHTGSAFSFISSAYAGVGNAVTIQQYYPKLVKLPSGEQFVFFADNIKPIKPSKLLIFKTDDKGILDKKIKYKSLIGKLERSQVLFEGSVTQDGTYVVEHKGKKYSIKIDEVLWYLYGADYMSISISEN
ncbi:MAG: hypothetical protein L3J98_17690 [Gammaproteobacteria bacterium]|nr:hypothetical protein [Gammaproteobacteria bacterium]MCF6261957.1 hypothetical protein [Gammaproteobacteria bacterium]